LLLTVVGSLVVLALTHRVRTAVQAHALVVVVWVSSFVLALATFAITNDHFGRISPARQIAVYGELPFRDFLDPGYFLTELTSAALILIFGDNLLGEWLLTSAFIAGGTAAVLQLALRLTGSRMVALAVAGLALLSFARAYDFDKVLFYPLALLLCWRYIDDRRLRDLWGLAACTSCAALFRYDTGVYIAAAAFTAIAIVHAGNWAMAARRAAALTAAVLGMTLPAIAFTGSTAGLGTALDQMFTYGRRETARTRLESSPRVSIGAWSGFLTVEQLNDPILVRWAPSVDDSTRLASESQYRLRDGKLNGPQRDRTWSYRMADASVDNLRALVRDPRVEDTHGVDRASSRLESETFLMRAGRRFPLLRWRLFPDAWTHANATAFLYYLLRWLPLAAALALLAGLQKDLSRGDLARISSLIVMCLLLNVFILRDPVAARVGGIAGPAAVLAAWLAQCVWRANGAVRGALRVSVAVLLVLTIWSVSAMAEWDTRLTREFVSASHVKELASTLGSSPPSPRALPAVQLAGLVKYLRECTRPEDRIFTNWFAPEIPFFTQRGFAGTVTLFDGHWREPRFEQRLVTALADSSVPIVIVETSRREPFANDYPALATYLRDHYRIAKETDFGNPEVDPRHYTLLVAQNRSPVRRYPELDVPCFAGS
jgi:hypothetical protein